RWWRRDRVLPACTRRGRCSSWRRSPRRLVKLPAFEDLSKEQDLIYNLDLDGNFLVSGPPGTGKSVMALYRAQMLSFDDREPAVLTYSNVLQQYTEQAANEIEVAG